MGLHRKKKTLKDAPGLTSEQSFIFMLHKYLQWGRWEEGSAITFKNYMRGSLVFCWFSFGREGEQDRKVVAQCPHFLLVFSYFASTWARSSRTQMVWPDQMPEFRLAIFQLGSGSDSKNRVHRLTQYLTQTHLVELNPALYCLSRANWINLWNSLELNTLRIHG